MSESPRVRERARDREGVRKETDQQNDIKDKTLRESVNQIENHYERWKKREIENRYIERSRDRDIHESSKIF